MASLENEPLASVPRDARRALNNLSRARALVASEDFGYLLRDTVALTVLCGGQKMLISSFTECQLYRALGPSCHGFSPLELTAELSDTEHADTVAVGNVAFCDNCGADLRVRDLSDFFK